MNRVNLKQLSGFLVECDGCGKKHVPLGELYNSKSYCVKCKEKLEKCSVNNNLYLKSEMKYFSPQKIYVYKPQEDYVVKSCVSKKDIYRGSVGEALNDEDRVFQKQSNGKFATKAEFEGSGYILLYNGKYEKKDKITVYHGINYPSDNLSQFLYDNGKLINNYSFKPEPVFNSTTEKVVKFKTKKGATITRGIPYLGAELEMSFGSNNKKDSAMKMFDLFQSLNLGELFYMKEDSSVDTGFEMVSHPSTLSWWKNQRIKELFDGIVASGGVEHESCGLHIHVSRDALTKKEWWTLISMLSRVGGKIKKFSRRTNFGYCKFKNKGVIEALEKGIKMFSDEVEEPERSIAVNFKNKNTVEFRFFNSTTNPTTFLASLSLVESLVMFVQNHSFMYIQDSKASELWREFTNFSQKEGYGSLMKEMVNLGLAVKKVNNKKPIICA